MGCGISTQSEIIRERMGEFQVKNPSKEIEVKSGRQVLDQPHHKIGDYFTVDIDNKRFKYFESRFTVLVQEELERRNLSLNWESPDSFITSLMRNPKARKDVFDIIKRKGFDHPYRWICYRLFSQATNENFEFDKKLEDTRRELYPRLIRSVNKPVDEIVNKDVLRTARHKELFQSFDAVGSQLLYDNCKAVGCFFPTTGYVQGMNFIMSFLLEVSGLEEFETFNFLVNFFKKRKNLYFGIYENGLPLLRFLVFCFHRLLAKKKPRVSEAIKQMKLPDELWVTKWLISFFCFSVTKDFMIRIFDFLMVVDMFGLVYVSVLLTAQIGSVFLTQDIGVVAELLGNPQSMCSKLDYQKFVKSLKKVEESAQTRLSWLEEYNDSLNESDRASFKYFYDKTHQRLAVDFKENHNEWEHVSDYPDMDVESVVSSLKFEN